MSSLDKTWFGGAVEKFLNSPPFKLARKNNPQTSHEAAQSVKDFAKHHQTQILECLQTFGALGKDGIAEHTKLDKSQVSRRLNEIEKQGLIVQTGRLVRSKSGRREREWISSY